PAASPHLHRLAVSGNVFGRLHAAWLLESMRSIDEDVVLTLLRDPHPRVRESGVKLSERFVTRSRPVLERILELADDADGRVRFQAALTLGDADDDRILAP